MGRSPCCSKEGLNRGAWTAHEDKILKDFISLHGEGRWRNLPKRAGLKRCGKSCRLRWLNYLRPDIKRGNITPDEEELIVRLHKLLGNRWSLIAGRLPGRTDNEIKNYWNTNLGKKMKNKNNNVASSVHQQPKSHSSPHSLSNVVRTKATRCSKVIITHRPPPPPPSGQLSPVMMTNPETEPSLPVEHVAAVAAAEDKSLLRLLGVGDDGGFHLYQEPSATDLLSDFNVGEISLSELLNSDFSEMCDFSNNVEGLSPSEEEQPFVFSDEALNDWRQSSSSNNVGNNNNNGLSFTSIFESSEEEWLAAE